jgi:hypothetical protein
MLFDLKGKRRRAVQGTYLTLAVLMGAGLVLFGIGSSTNGGLGDLFNGGSGSNKGNAIVLNRIKAANRTLTVQPKSAAALGILIRSNYQLATANADQLGNFQPKAIPDLQHTTQAWQRYLATNPPKPDLGLAQVAVQAYAGLAGLVKSTTAQQSYYKGATQAFELVTAAQPTVQNYLTLVRIAAAGGQNDIATKAGNKAIALAPAKQKKAVKQAVTQAKTPQQAQPQPVNTGQSP